MHFSSCRRTVWALLLVALLVAVLAPVGTEGASSLNRMFGKKKKKQPQQQQQQDAPAAPAAQESAAAGASLRGLKVSELMARARAAGRDAAEIEDAMDSDDPKVACEQWLQPPLLPPDILIAFPSLPVLHPPHFSP